MSRRRVVLAFLTVSLLLAAVLVGPREGTDAQPAPTAPSSVEARPQQTRALQAPPQFPAFMTARVVPSRVTPVTVRHVVPATTAGIGPRLAVPASTRDRRDNWQAPVAAKSGQAVDARPQRTQPAAQGAQAPTAGLMSKFESLDLFDSTAIPPDPMGAAGPNHLFTVVNVHFAIHRQSDGAIVESGPLSDFFAPLVPETFVFDPKVVFDPYEERFVVIGLEVTQVPLRSRILVAVSDDADPEGNWSFTAINALIPVGGETSRADFPGLGLDEEAVYVTANMFGVNSRTFRDAHLWIIDKGAGSGGLYDGGPAAVSSIDPPDGFGTVFNRSMQPADLFAPHPDAGVGTFLATYNGAHDAQTGQDFLHVFTLLDPLGTPTLVDEFVPLGHIDDLDLGFPEAPQPVQLGADLFLNDRSVLDNAGRGTRFAVTTQIVPPVGSPDTGQITAHWVLLDGSVPGSTTVVDQGDIGGEDIAPGTFTFFPSIAINTASTLAVGFSASGPETYAGAYYTFRKVGDPAGSMRSAHLLQRGLDFYINMAIPGPNRWGDYSGITPDPGDDCFWVFNEFANRRDPLARASDDGVWSTVWGELCPELGECGNALLEPGETCDPPGSGCSDTCSFCGDGNVDVGETCDPPGGDCRADCTTCGDGLVQAEEACDDFNTLSGDGCDASCRVETCGNGVVQAGETCDPPGLPAGPDVCRFDCSACGDGTLDPDTIELLRNGDFEFGNTFGWWIDRAGAGLNVPSRPGAVTPLSGWPTDGNPFGGGYYVVSDELGAGTHALAQTFQVPPDATAVELSFRMFVNDLSGDGPLVDPAGLDHTVPLNQHARVDLLLPGFDPFATSGAAVVRNFYLGVDPGAPPSPYTEYTFDITADVTPGQSYVVRFADTENQFVLNLGVDNVSVVATVPQPEACDDGNNVDGDGCSGTCEAGCGSATNAFSQPVFAVDEDTFAWELPVDTAFVRGNLALVGAYDVIASGTVAGTTSVTAVPLPRPGAGFYLLFRVDCPLATWTSSGVGECCDRDAALP